MNIVNKFGWWFVIASLVVLAWETGQHALAVTAFVGGVIATFDA